MELYYDDVDHDVLILRADGGLNAETADDLLHQLGVLVDAGLEQIIVDCQHLDYISTYGVSLLLRLHKKLATRGGDVKLAAIHSGIVDALAGTHLDHLFDIYP